MPPSFEDVEYWNARFVKEREFEWLSGPDEILPYIKAALANVPRKHQNILHIGPGSSALSFTLRGLVSDPQLIHNVDYSESAISLGKAREQEAFTHNQNSMMRWTCANLLDRNCIENLMDDNRLRLQYSLIVDKSTTDSISCGVEAVLDPNSFRCPSEYAGSYHRSGPEKIHPTILLSLHLAIVAAPGAYWLCVSYSRDRFPFLIDHEESCDTVEAINPARYWTLEKMEPLLIDKPERTGARNAFQVHRPQITHWIYILRRTEHELKFSTAF